MTALSETKKRRKTNPADGYAEFLKRKTIVDVPTGLKRVPKLNDRLFDFQKAIVEWALRRGRAAIFADCGLGKGQPYGAKILTPSGFVENTDLKVGDMIIGSSGKAYPVMGIYRKQTQKTYRIHFSDRSSFVVDEDHLHIVRTNNMRQRKKGWKVLSTRDLLECGNIRYGADGKSMNYDIPVVSPIQYDSTPDNEITPYVLGVLIGDGTINGSVTITSPDREIIERVERELPEGVHLKKCSDIDYRVKTGLAGTKRHPFRQELIDLGLYGKTSEYKFIPESYLYASDVAFRLDLLRGLMDTDGYIDKGGTSIYYTKSPKLADDVRDLVRSLGCVPTINKKDAKLNGKDCGTCYCVTFSLATFNPFYLSRKAERYNPHPRGNGRWIARIEYECDQPTICISVDSPDSSYVTENFIVTHNTAMQLEWAAHVPGNVLILAPLAVAQQTKREGEKFGIEVGVARKQKDVSKKITVANYEMLQHFDAPRFDGVVLDESSILKSHDGKTRTEIIESFSKTPFRLACTATPAPNDHMELSNHAEFLGTMTRQEMLAMFFVHDGGETSKWRLKGHAQREFWKWVCSWAVMIKNPSDLGFDGSRFSLPPLNIENICVDVIEPTDGFLFPVEARTLGDRLKSRRSTIGGRVATCAEIVNASTDQFLVWCSLNAESEMLAKSIPGAVEVSGSDTPEKKEAAMIGFSNGEIRVLVTKPLIAGFGMNWQNCSNMAYVGLSDSYEQFYQSVRRCWRFGQKNPVNVYVITAETEGAVVENIKRKERDAEIMAKAMAENMRDLSMEAVSGSTKRTNAEYSPRTAEGDSFIVHNADCIEALSKMKDGSIHFSIYSPPFSSLYTYSNSERDMGNCKSNNEFFEHYRFLVSELHRVTMPGRLVAFHCMNLPASKVSDGFIGIKDFRGDLIRIHQDAGFVYHSEVCIWKDPVTAMQRTKAIGLLNKQKNKDSCLSRQGIADYLVVMRKLGDNPEPVSHTNDDFSIDLWQQYASPVWMDINPSDTLQFRSARENDDERHICPLQLEVIRRALKLWSNEGDTVLSPFAGIGSEGHVSIEMGRRFIGCELKPSYFDAMVNNLQKIEREVVQKSLFLK